MKSPLSNQRGAAIVIAIWLMVMLSALALEFSLVSHDRQQFGIAAAERGWGQAANMGALAILQARMDMDIAQVGVAGYDPQTRQSDAWLDADSFYTGFMAVDSTAFSEVYVQDLGGLLNINTANEQQLTAFFNYMLNAGDAAPLIAAILDWRDVDDNPRVGGGMEREDYLRAGYLTLPGNRPFRDPGELLQVAGMTEDIYRYVAPYLTTLGNGSININTAPEPVLWSIPNMNQDIVNLILSYRDGGRRINNIQQVTPTGTALNNVELTSNELLVTLLGWKSETTGPAKMRALMTRNGNTVTITWRQW